MSLDETIRCEREMHFANQIRDGEACVVLRDLSFKFILLVFSSNVAEKQFMRCLVT